MDVTADPACAVSRQPPVCDPSPPATKSTLCGHTAEEFAEAALMLEPRGPAWCKLFDTTKAALHRAFGKLLADFESRLCVLFEESLACNSMELLSEWERDYGLPGDCSAGPPAYDIAARQAQVCAARKGVGISTSDQLQALLRVALQCPQLTVTPLFSHSMTANGAGQPLITSIGICLAGIGPGELQGVIHNKVGGWGLIAGPSSQGFGVAAGQPLTLEDPEYSPSTDCPIVYHSTVAGWTGGVGSKLITADPIKYGQLVCLMRKHLPAHIAWDVCVTE